MRTRFGGSYLSYIVAVGWPFTHMAILFGLYVFANRFAPVGDMPGVFVTTGVAPYILTLYPARLTSYALIQSMPLLQFPIVRPIHLIAARAALEMLSAIFVFTVFASILLLAGFATLPEDYSKVASAIFMAIYFGTSVGIFGVTLIAAIGPAAPMILFTLILACYFSSGAFVPTIFMASAVKEWLWYNPLYHIVGTLRGAFFDAYALENFSLFYVFMVANVFIVLGLLGERMIRGKLLKG